MRKLLQQMVDDWPQVFADDLTGDTDMNGGDAVEALSGYVRRARALLAAEPECFTVLSLCVDDAGYYDVPRAATKAEVAEACAHVAKHGDIGMWLDALWGEVNDRLTLAPANEEED